MTGAGLRRRTVLRAIGGAGIGVVAVSLDRSTPLGRDQSGTAQAHVPDSELSIPGSKHTLSVTTTESETTGPTALVIGGVHGDEEAGYLAAAAFSDWTPPMGRLVVLPKANPEAIANGTRGADASDLNRQFVADGAPTTPLARRIWDLVERTNPALLVSLHESRGVYGGKPDGVGQTIFHSPGTRGRDGARMAVRRANRHVEQPALRFKRGTISPPSVPPSGLLTERAAYEANIPSYIVETYEGRPIENRIVWQQAAVRGVLDYFDLID